MKLDKEKTVIVHKATCNHGKTLTLKKLARFLLLPSEENKLYFKQIRRSEEVWAISYNGCNIAIITFGDSGFVNDIQGELDELEAELKNLNKSIDIYIAASHLNCAVIKFWKRLADERNCNFIETSPTYIADLEESKSNEKPQKDYGEIHDFTAKHLKQLIDFVIRNSKK